MKARKLHIIMPVKDSLQTAEEAIRCLLTHYPAAKDCLTVYNDFSTPENTARLQTLAVELGFQLLNWAEHTTHPSPNYRFTLQDAQAKANAAGAHLVIIESDVFVRENSIPALLAVAEEAGVGMVANMTTDDKGVINFPYLYAQKLHGERVDTKKRFSFCCTLLTSAFLQAFDFNDLDETKNWYDVFISHKSVELGYRNVLLLRESVIHRPHSSRPWKQLKYTNPIKYYWLKITQRRDKI